MPQAEIAQPPLARRRADDARCLDPL